MPLSISSSEQRSLTNGLLVAQERSFFPRAVMLLGLMGIIFSLFNFVANRLIPPDLKFPGEAALVAGDHCIYTFGNSRFRAAIDEEKLAALLSQPGDVVGVHQFTGNSWDSIHYYTLSLLSKDILRPGRDVVLIELSPISLDDTVELNRLDAIPPQASIPVALLPHESLEMRLEVLFAATSAAFRSRIAFHRGWIHDGATSRVEGLQKILQSFGLQRPMTRGGPIQVSPDVSNDLQLNEQWRRAFRHSLELETKSMHFGGLKLTALRLAVQTLRSRNIPVYLVQTPTSPWYHDQLRTNPANLSFRHTMPEVAKTSGSELILDWPAEAYDATHFGDDVHMLRGPQGAEYFTRLLASELIKRNWKMACHNRTLPVARRRVCARGS